MCPEEINPSFHPSILPYFSPWHLISFNTTPRTLQSNQPKFLRFSRRPVALEPDPRPGPHTLIEFSLRSSAGYSSVTPASTTAGGVPNHALHSCPTSRINHNFYSRGFLLSKSALMAAGRPAHCTSPFSSFMYHVPTTFALFTSASVLRAAVSLLRPSLSAPATLADDSCSAAAISDCSPFGFFFSRAACVVGVFCVGVRT